MCAVIRNPGFWFHFFAPRCQCQHGCGSLMLARTDYDLLYTTSIAPIQTEGMTGPLNFWMHFFSTTCWFSSALQTNTWGSSLSFNFRNRGNTSVTLKVFFLAIRTCTQMALWVFSTCLQFNWGKSSSWWTVPYLLMFICKTWNMKRGNFLGEIYKKVFCPCVGHSMKANQILQPDPIKISWGVYQIIHWWNFQKRALKLKVQWSPHQVKKQVIAYWRSPFYLHLHIRPSF